MHIPNCSDGWIGSGDNAGVGPFTTVPRYIYRCEIWYIMEHTPHLMQLT